MGKFIQGIFKPKYPEKYDGDHTNIIYRSSWELKAMLYLDKHPGVIKWGSEETIIPYISPIDNRKHRYFVDFKVTLIDKDGVQRTALLEVKPEKQTKPPKVLAKPTKRYLIEVRDWGVNSAKWEAAKSYCANRGWSFHVITEKHLNIT